MYIYYLYIYTYIRNLFLSFSIFFLSLSPALSLARSLSHHTPIYTIHPTRYHPPTMVALYNPATTLDCLHPKPWNSKTLKP